MRVIHFAEACSRFEEIIDQVADDADYTLIVGRDGADAVVMSLDTFNSLMETVHLMRSPANAAHPAKSIAQYQEGRLPAATTTNR